MNAKQEWVPIGKLARELGVTTRTLRYYEEIRLLPQAHRLEGGCRAYDDAQVKRLKFILKLKELGISLAQMQELAKVYEAGEAESSYMPKLLEILETHITQIDEKMARIATLRREIVEFRALILERMKGNPES